MRARRAIAHEEPTLLSTSLRFLYADYRPEFQMWELVETVRKIVLAGYYMLLAQGTCRQLLYALVTQLGFIYLQGLVAPYRLRVDNLLALTCHLVTAGPPGANARRPAASSSDQSRFHSLYTQCVREWPVAGSSGRG